MIKLKQLFNKKEVKRTLFLIAAIVFILTFLIGICHSSKSMALTAFSYLVIFDFLTLFVIILNSLIDLHGSDNAFTYGYKRCEVLAVFTCTTLAMLGSFFIIKECFESFFEEKEVHTGRLIPGVLLAFTVHMFITKFIKNKTFEHVIEASSSSWLQVHVTELSETLCHYIPGLSRLLLPRLNPFSLLGFACLLISLVTYTLLQMGSTYLADIQAAMLISLLMFGTMWPMALYTGKILLQTTPAHLIGQLDKALREASTLDGVLEFRNEHFWTLSFGVVVGSLHVRVRRDADEQLVLAHVTSKLSGLVQILTIHIFKDDWIRQRTHQLVYNTSSSGLPNSNLFYTPASPSPVQQPQLASYNPALPLNMNFNNRPQTVITNPLLVNSRKNATATTATTSDNEYVVINP